MEMLKKTCRTKKDVLYIFKALGYVGGLWVSEAHIKL